MEYTTETHTISIDGPVSEAIVKVLQYNAPWDIELVEETGQLTGLDQEEDSTLVKPTFLNEKPLGLSEWLSIAYAKLSRSLVTTFAATQLNLARLSSDPQVTGPIDMTAIFEIVALQRYSAVVISADLVAPRSEVHASCLLAPSGGYLAWIEMLQENHDDGNE